ncbi:MAG: type II toxin-antitoxin system VapB family antitoxin [candidate division NC10 bacterium]|nr:type II toxin-antitoxin system VapB family antitoxin [candidate division NC10 bacterium]
MRITIEIDDELLNQALALTKAKTKKKLIHRSLEALIRQQRIERLLGKLGRCPFSSHQEGSPGSVPMTEGARAHGTRASGTPRGLGGAEAVPDYAIRLEVGLSDCSHPPMVCPFQR